MSKGDSIAIICAFIGGAACGVMAGVLLAPYLKEGTREKIKEIGEKIKEKGAAAVEKARDFLKPIEEEIKEDIVKDTDEKKSKILRAVEAGKKAMKEEIESVKKNA